VTDSGIGAPGRCIDSVTDPRQWLQFRSGVLFPDLWSSERVLLNALFAVDARQRLCDCSDLLSKPVMGLRQLETFMPHQRIRESRKLSRRFYDPDV
jgi:hypothetical protein